MEFRNLGSTGLRVSAVGIGCNNFGRRCDADSTRAVVSAAVTTGINFFDTADIYGPRGLSEEYLGLALKKHARHDLVIASKFGGPMGDGELMKGGSRRYIMYAVDESLRRLGTDYIDLYQQHFPDTQTSFEETLSALDDVVRAGKVRYIGHSNYTGWQIAHADWIGKSGTRFVTAQNEYSLLDRRIEREVIPACEAFGLGMLPYFPLASGLLTGKYTRNQQAPADTRLSGNANALSDANFDIVEALSGFALERGHTLLELAMSWLACQGTVVSVIAGATGPGQVEANAAAINWQLSPEEMSEVDRITRR